MAIIINVVKILCYMIPSPFAVFIDSIRILFRLLCFIVNAVVAKNSGVQIIFYGQIYFVELLIVDFYLNTVVIIDLAAERQLLIEVYVRSVLLRTNWIKETIEIS